MKIKFKVVSDECVYILSFNAKGYVKHQCYDDDGTIYDVETTFIGVDGDDYKSIDNIVPFRMRDLFCIENDGKTIDMSIDRLEDVTGEEPEEIAKIKGITAYAGEECVFTWEREN